MIENKNIKRWQKAIEYNKRIVALNKHSNSRAAFKAERHIKELERRIEINKNSPFLKSFGSDRYE